MVNGLYNSSRTALATLRTVQQSVEQHTAQLGDLGASAAELSTQQQQLRAGVLEGLQELQQLRQQGWQLEAQLNQSLMNLHLMEQQLQDMQQRAVADMQVGWWQAACCICLRLRVPLRLWCIHSTVCASAAVRLQALSDTARAHAEEAQMQWHESISHARALEACQQSYEQVMMAIGDSSQQILNRSQQIASSLDVVADYQGRWGGWLAAGWACL
jgi:hypothetical protein